MRETSYIQSVDEWHRLIAEKREDRDLLVLKLSPVCGASHWAQGEVERWLEGFDGDPGFDLYRVDVVADRSVSQAIAERLGIRHESPQLIWIGPGVEVRWHASHGGVSKRQLERLLASDAQK